MHNSILINLILIGASDKACVFRAVSSRSLNRDIDLGLSLNRVDSRKIIKKIVFYVSFLAYDTKTMQYFGNLCIWQCMLQSMTSYLLKVITIVQGHIYNTSPRHYLARKKVRKKHLGKKYYIQKFQDFSLAISW